MAGGYEAADMALPRVPPDAGHEPLRGQRGREVAVQPVQRGVVLRGARAPCTGPGCACCVELSGDFLAFAANFGVKR